MALSVLQLVSSIFHLCTQPPDQNLCVEGHARNDLVISPVFEFPMAVSKDQARRLVYSLRDSYDANRALVVELLSSFPLESHGLQVCSPYCMQDPMCNLCFAYRTLLF